MHTEEFDGLDGSYQSSSRVASDQKFNDWLKKHRVEVEREYAEHQKSEGIDAVSFNSFAKEYYTLQGEGKE